MKTHDPDSLAARSVDDVKRVMAEIEARKRTRQPSTVGKQGAIATRSTYALLKNLANMKWGQSAYFPRSQDYLFPIEVIDFLKFHIALFKRAESENFDDYTNTFKTWIRLCGGRLPLRMRRYLGSDYRASIPLRALELEWGRLGGCPLDEEEVYFELDIARFHFPDAKSMTELQIAYTNDPTRVPITRNPAPDEYIIRHAFDDGPRESDKKTYSPAGYARTQEEFDRQQKGTK